MLQKLYDWLFPPISDSEHLQAVRMKVAYSTLKKLHHARTLLEIHAPDETDEIYHSIIIGFNLHNGKIIIDAPVPSIPDQYENQKLAIHSLLDGSHYQFKSQYYGHNINNQDNCLIELPDKVYKSTRRIDKRLPVTKQHPVKAYFNTPGAKGYFGLAENISRNGLKLRLIGNTPDDLQNGSIIQNCRLQLDDSTSLYKHLLVCEIGKYKEPFKHVTIRAKFFMEEQRRKSAWDEYLETYMKKQASREPVS